ncbi:MAG: FlxA-like family protein [Verrucomicrobia bacterium]|nr:FlxA-like family protein [Verrucomicrobiota bacterium]
MSISGISTSGGSTTSSSAVDSAIAQTQKQITKVQKEIRDENNSDDDAKTKADLVRTYTTELLALQLKLAQLQLQKTEAAEKSGKGKTPAAAQSAAQAQTPKPSETSLYFNELA